MAPYLVASGHAALAWAVSLKIMTRTVAYNVFFVINNILAEAVFVTSNNFLPVLAHYRPDMEVLGCMGPQVGGGGFARYLYIDRNK